MKLRHIKSLKHLNFMTNKDILLLSVSGIANERIAKHTGMTIEDIKETLNYYLGFDGFVTTLDFSPWRLYRVDRDSLLTTDEMYVTICKRFEELRKEMDEWQST